MEKPSMYAHAKTLIIIILLHKMVAKLENYPSTVPLLSWSGGNFAAPVMFWLRELYGSGGH